jgi:hypothetical protein
MKVILFFLVLLTIFAQGRIEERHCRPEPFMPEAKFGELSRTCSRKFQRHLFWAGKPCYKNTKDGGAQCLGFCGFQCRIKCMKYEHCNWVDSHCERIDNEGRIKDSRDLCLIYKNETEYEQ